VVDIINIYIYKKQQKEVQKAKKEWRPNYPGTKTESPTNEKARLYK
jgi:hypothetical protein